MTDSLLSHLDWIDWSAYKAGVEADTPVTPDDAQARSLHAKRRRRPAVGAEAERRKEFGRVYGQANAAAGQEIRESRRL